MDSGRFCMNIEATSLAVTENDIKKLRDLVSRGYAWDASAAICAADWQHLDIVRFFCDELHFRYPRNVCPILFEGCEILDPVDTRSYSGWSNGHLGHICTSCKQHCMTHGRTIRLLYRCTDWPKDLIRVICNFACEADARCKQRRRPNIKPRWRLICRRPTTTGDEAGLRLDARRTKSTQQSHSVGEAAELDDDAKNYVFLHTLL